MPELDEAMKVYKLVRGDKIAPGNIEGKTEAEVLELVAQVDRWFNDHAYTCDQVGRAMLRPMRRPIPPEQPPKNVVPRWLQWLAILIVGWMAHAGCQRIALHQPPLPTEAELEAPQEQALLPVPQPQPPQQRGVAADNPAFSTIND